MRKLCRFEGDTRQHRVQWHCPWIRGTATAHLRTLINPALAKCLAQGACVEMELQMVAMKVSLNIAEAQEQVEGRGKSK